MRIVILTADSVVDRRLAPEPGLLARNGCEVIVLAAREPTQPEFERIDDLKVEHCAPIVRDRLGRRMGSWRNKAIMRLNTISENTQNFIGSRVTLLNSRIEGLYARNVNRYARAFRRRMLLAVRNGYIKSLTALLAIYQFTGRLIYAVEPLGGWLDRRLPGARKSLAAVMSDRALYYDPDIVHVHGAACLPLGARVKKALRIPLIYDPRGLTQSPPQSAPDRHRRVLSTERRYRAVADRVLAGRDTGDDYSFYRLLAVCRELINKPGGSSSCG